MIVRVAALAGRRIDAGDGARRFPLDRRQKVKRSIGKAFSEHHIGILVSSAACGADLLAISEAMRLGIEFRIILPFSIARFRAQSVVDRPGNWGSIFDKAITQSVDRNSLTILDMDDREERAFSAANRTILQGALALAHNPIAVVVWDGTPRGEGDSTAEFAHMAGEAMLQQIEIMTV